MLTFKPHGDLAIANGIAHLLLKNGTYDKAFVEKHCNFRKDTAEPSLNGQPMNFDEYRAAMEQYTPEEWQTRVDLAAAYRLREALRGRKVALILSGGNCSLAHLREALAL